MNLAIPIPSKSIETNSKMIPPKMARANKQPDLRSFGLVIGCVHPMS